MEDAEDEALFAVDYQPRPQFRAFHARKERFACIVAHRRAGKTVACVHDLQRGAVHCKKQRPRFAYLSPFLRQSKQVAWDYLRAAMVGGRVCGARVHETELRVDYPNGGQVRLFGADNPDALRGIYLDGVVLDEYADMDPRVWSEIIRPALADRQGWAVFIGTPRGRNAFFELWRRAQSEEGWYSVMHKASETGLIPESELALARRDLTEEQYAQEFECSFDAAVIGTYYGKLMLRAEAEGRTLPQPIRIGVMLEVPSLLWQLPALCKRIDFLSIGTNDLMQFLFACDRGNPRLADRYDPLSMPMLALFREVVARTGEAGVPLSMCGEMAGNPIEAMALIALGFRTLSMAATAIGPIKTMIRSLDAAAVALYLDEIGGRPDHSLRSKLEAYARDHAVAL